jgi:hypothetical protein
MDIGMRIDLRRVRPREAQWHWIIRWARDLAALETCETGWIIGDSAFEIHPVRTLPPPCEVMAKGKLKREVTAKPRSSGALLEDERAEYAAKTAPKPKKGRPKKK